MTDSTLLDIIALIGGGRGDPLTDLTPHLLAAVNLAIFCIFLWRSGQGSRHNGEKLLLFTFAALTLSAVVEILSASGTLASIHAFSDHGVFWPPVAIALCVLVHLFTVATFTMGIEGQRRLMTDFMAVSAATLLLAGAYVLFIWWQVHINDTATLFDEQPFVWVIPGSGFILTGIALIQYFRYGRTVRWPLVSAISLLLIQFALQMAILVSRGNAAPVLQPIAACLTLGSYLLFCYAALRFHLENKARMQNRIESAQRMHALGLLSSGIAHDFNNHLQIITGYVELGNSANNPASNRQALQRIGEAADRAGRLVNQLLAFSRNQTPQFKCVDLNETIVRLTPMLARLAGNDTRLVHDLDLSAKPIDADESMIEQVIINLVTNARDAVDHKGVITISTQSWLHEVSNEPVPVSQAYRTRLSVSDTGTGMDDQTIDRMFDPFFTTKIDGGGTGLGLATVHNIVQKHNGCISVDSKPGEYTNVMLDFTATENSPATMQSSSTSQLIVPRGKGETILLAEKDQTIRELARSLLASSGYKVLIAVNGQHAINISNTYKPGIDLCLFNINMPLLNGSQTYLRIVKEHPEVPALFLTGTSLHNEHRLEGAHYLQKPFSKTELLFKVQDVLQKGRTVVNADTTEELSGMKSLRHAAGLSS